VQVEPLLERDFLLVQRDISYLIGITLSMLSYYLEVNDFKFVWRHRKTLIRIGSRAGTPKLLEDRGNVLSEDSAALDLGDMIPCSCEYYYISSNEKSMECDGAAWGCFCLLCVFVGL
jgi:hypothetical protein